MHDPQENSSRPLISITPRRKSVRFNFTSPSPRAPPVLEPRPHALNVSYTIPSTTVNIDHVTQHSHRQHANNHVEYIPTARRQHLQITGEKIHPSTQTLDELHQFMRKKAEHLRQNMTKISTTFDQASDQLHRLKEEREAAPKKPSRIPISTRQRSPSPPVVIYRKPQHRSLADLRWYCLARKFAHLWRERTFKRTNAVEFHHRRLLTNAFALWLHSVRHDHQLTRDHLHRRRMKNTWNLWRLQWNKRRLRQHHMITAREQYDRQLTFRVSSNPSLPSYVDCFPSPVQFYTIWQISTSHRRQEAQKDLRAQYHRRIHLHRICFHAWLTYAEYRRRKNAHKSISHAECSWVNLDCLRTCSRLLPTASSRKNLCRLEAGADEKPVDPAARASSG